MSDLISRQAAIEAVEKAATKECARWVIQEIPPVDVAPVVHAHWIYVELGTPTSWSYRCSNCLCLRLSGFPSEYCPYCGAKMDGGE